jgi:hypothetical protein
MSDLPTNLAAPSPRARSEARRIGDAFAPLMAGVNLWTVSDAGVQVAASTSASAATALPTNDGAISILARGGAIRFRLGGNTVAAASTSNLLDAGERIDLLLKEGQTHISVISDTGAPAGTLDIMGLGTPAE